MTERAVHWHEGMFLRPHHFQAAQRYWQQVAGRNAKLDVYYNWGLQSVQLDLNALANYRLEVTALTARLRDGTVVVVPDDGTLPAVDLRSIFEREHAVTAFLALPVVSLAKANVTGGGMPEGARYRLDVQELEDENTGINPQPIQVRLPDLRVLLSTQDAGGYEALPLARIQKSFREDATPELDETYIPPLLACDAWRPLWIGILRSIYDRIGKKIDRLAGQVHTKGTRLDNYGDGEISVIGQLRELNYAYGRLGVLVFAAGIHPLAAYVELCGVAGQLSIFSPLHRLPELPRYDHDDLGGCFYRVKQYLDELLELLIEPGYQERPFIGAGLRMQVALEGAWVGPEWQFFIGVQSPLPAEECVRLLTVAGQLDMKVGSSERVDTIYRLGQAGLQFVPVPQPPRVLPATADLVYFQLRRDTGAPEWGHAHRSLSLALRLNENRIAGTIQGERTLKITLGTQVVPIRFTLYAVPAREPAA